MKAAFLSNVNINMLQSFLPKEDTYYFPDGYDTIFQELTDTNSALIHFAPDVLFVLPYAESAIEKYGDYFCEEFLQNLAELVFRYAQETPHTKVFVSELVLTHIRIEALSVCNGSETGIAEWNYKIHVKSNQLNNLFVFPMIRLVAQTKDAFFSSKLNYLGKIPYSMVGQRQIAEQIGNIINALRKKRKKCLLLDLDNTLWGGVIGEDGINGIRLSNDGDGKPYYDSQLRIKAMQKTGVLLAIVSKNNAEDAMLPFRQHKYSVLKENDFAICKANWCEKVENIRAIAAELNIGLDAMVFLDDNGVEREKVKIALPQVTVVDFPKDITMLPDTLGHIYEHHFLIDVLTAEDIDKTKSYQIEHVRAQQRENAKDIRSFIKSLQIKINLHHMRANETERVAQLTQKTNQFNLTTKRFTVNEMQEYIAANGNEVYVADVRDRYGEYGLVMAIMLHCEKQHVHIDNILMSCRVMGRDVENSVMKELAARMRTRGVREWTGEYIASQKNLPVCNLYDSWGFSVLQRENGKFYRSEQVHIEETLCEVTYDG